MSLLRRPRQRSSALVLCVWFLLMAACGGDTPSDPEPAELAPSTTTSTAPPATTPAPATTTTAPPTTTTTTTLPPPEYEPALISYRYPSTGELEYAMSIEQLAEVTLEGETTEGMPPGAIETATTMEGTVSYQTSPGPEPNTIEVRIVSDLETVESRTSIGGVSIPTPSDEEIPGIGPIDITVVVDEQGNVLEVASEALDALSGFFGEDSFLPTDSMGGQNLNRPFGPVFPDRPLEVGDTWTDAIEQEGPAGMGTILTTAEHRLVEVVTQGNSHILVVESEYLTEGFEWDLSEMLAGLLGAFAQLGAEDGETPDLGEIPEMTMVMSSGPSTVVATTRFDIEAGLVLEGDYRSSGEIATDMTIPDGSGNLTAIISSTVYDQTVTYRLISPAA